MKSSCSSVSFRRSMVCMLFVFVLVAFISFTGTATVVYAETFTVTTTSDNASDPDSLRYAINHATSQDVITFGLDYPVTITLESQLRIDHGLTIQGPGADLLAVSGGGVCRVFFIEDTAESVDIWGISIVSGDEGSDYSRGGGIYNRSDNLNLDSCHFSGNQAYEGGGMYNEYDSAFIVTNCTFSSNSAVKGGGMFNKESSPTVTNCTFSGNNADYGGGMKNYIGSGPTVTNCTFYLNSADDGGGMNNDIDSSPTVTNCTFYLNNATQYGGGMYNYQSSPTVTNCIFWDTSGCEIYNFPNQTFPSNPNLSFCVVQSNDVGDGAISKDIISADPELELLVDNGCPTWTCSLGEGSSAIDAGTSDGAPSTDQRGAPRPFNGSFDIGAYEYGLEVYEITATSSEGGTILPTEAHTLAGIEDEVFYLVPNEGYVIEAVYVDDFAIDSSEIINNTFTFEDVTENHSIHADFKPGYDGDGCNITALPGVGIFLMLPLLFLSGKMK